MLLLCKIESHASKTEFNLIWPVGWERLVNQLYHRHNFIDIVTLNIFLKYTADPLQYTEATNLKTTFPKVSCKFGDAEEILPLKTLIQNQTTWREREKERIQYIYFVDTVITHMHGSGNCECSISFLGFLILRLVWLG